jgi:hypothetical protein
MWLNLRQFGYLTKIDKRNIAMQAGWVSTGLGYLPHAIARFPESNPFSLEAAPGRSVHVGLRQINFFQKQKKLKNKLKVPREKSKKSDSETYWQVVRWGGRGKTPKGGVGFANQVHQHFVTLKFGCTSRYSSLSNMSTFFFLFFLG